MGRLACTTQHTPSALGAVQTTRATPLTFSSTRLPLNCSGAMYMGYRAREGEGEGYSS